MLPTALGASPPRRCRLSCWFSTNRGLCIHRHAQEDQAARCWPVTLGCAWSHMQLPGAAAAYAWWLGTAFAECDMAHDWYMLHSVCLCDTEDLSPWPCLRWKVGRGVACMTLMCPCTHVHVLHRLVTTMHCRLCLLLLRTRSGWQHWTQVTAVYL